MINIQTDCVGYQPVENTSVHSGSPGIVLWTSPKTPLFEIPKNK